MGSRGPFALFVVVNVEHKRIDEILESTIGGYAPAFWLTTEKYDAPKKQYNLNEGTRPPIPKSFKSPWIGTPINELIEWLKAKPEDIDLNERHFAIFDKGARDNPATVVVCRIGNHRGEGNDLFVLRKSSEHASSQLVGAPADDWDETVRQGGNAEIGYDDDENEA